MLKKFVIKLGEIILAGEDLIIEWIRKLKSAKMFIAMILLLGYFYLLWKALPIILTDSVVAIFAITVTGTLVTGVITWFFKLRMDEKSPLMKLVPSNYLNGGFDEKENGEEDEEEIGYLEEE